MLRKIFLPGLVSGLLAAIAALIYRLIYLKALGADFSQVFSTAAIFISCIAGTLVASLGYFLLEKWLKDKTPVVFNLLFLVLSFASIVGPFAVKLPLELETPELFPGLTVPMHFFPVLAWLALSPVFYRRQTAVKVE